MLLLSEKLLQVPVMSLQTGTQLALTTDVIVDPKNLTITACYVAGEGVDSDPSVLFMEDIREAGELGFIIDDSTRLMPLEGLVRLQAIIDTGFTLIGAQVVDIRGNKVGKVTDYSFTPLGYTVQQLFVKPGFVQSLLHASRIIHRKQILDIKDNVIIVDSPDVTEKIREKAEKAGSLVNPFRSPDIEPR
jgi:sporulation protein YlmC with PRC-barrel domain